MRQFTAAEAALRLSVTRDVVYDLIEQGRLKIVPFAVGSFRIAEEAVEELRKAWVPDCPGGNNLRTRAKKAALKCRMLTISEVAVRLSVSKRTVQRMIRRHELTSTRRGHRFVRIPEWAVDGWIQKFTRASIIPGC